MKPTASRPSRGKFAWLRWLDDAVFAVEQAIVAAFLIAITVMVFLDVVYRRLSSPGSKVGDLIARIGGIDEPAARAMLDAQIAPVAGAIAGLVLLWFAFWSAERKKGAPLIPVKQSALVLALITAAACVAIGWLMLVAPSRYVYLALYAVAVLAYVARLLSTKPSGWVPRAAGVVLVASPFFVYVALNWFPRGYSWSKELSLLLLLWVGFLGASVCAHEGKHLKMEAFAKILPEGAKRWIHALGHVGTAGFCFLMAVLGYYYVFHPETGTYVRGGVFEQTGIPDWTGMVVVPIAFGLTALRFIAAAVSAVLGGTYGLPPADESLSEAEKAKAELEGAPVEEEAARG